jgi:accessory colonization factor AcfC
MCVSSIRQRFGFLGLLLGLGAVSVSAANPQNILHVYGAEGPYPAIREAAQTFGNRHHVEFDVVGKPTSKWLDKAKQDADLIYSSAEFMMTDFIRDMDGCIDETSVTSLYWRPSAILVRPGNPKHIHDFPDLLRPGVTVMVVNGSGQVGLWEDMAGKQGNFRTVRALRNNIVFFASNSTEARRTWLARKEIDAWLTWNIWYKADSRHSDLVPLSEDYVIYRQCSIALTQRGANDPLAAKFIEFLAGPEAAGIFAKWGWITTADTSTPLTARSVIRIVHDVQDDEWESRVGKGLARIRKLVEDYKSLGIPPSQVNVAVILHGGAAYWALKDEPYSAFVAKEVGNPNSTLIHDLVTSGISVEVCAQAMKHHGWARTDILPGVKIVAGVCPRVVELERQGYSYMRL